MKHTIKLLFLCLVIATGCKKEAKDRILEVTGTNLDYTVSIDKADKENPGWGGANGYSEMMDKNETFTRTLDGEYTYKLIVKSDSSNFNCKVMIDGKNIYHKDGKEHHLEF
jgi:hypothetical protein